MKAIRSKVDNLRERLAPPKKTSDFRNTGQITPEEFVLAGDYLVYKFPSWSWAAAGSPAKTVTYLPAEKQYLVTRGVPCHRRLDEHFAGDEERLIKGGEGFDQGDDEDGWLSTGGDARYAGANPDKVQAISDKGEVEAVEEEEIPDMEDDDDEAIIKDQGAGAENTPLRTYNLYITYSTYYSTPRVYLSGYARPASGASQVPLPPSQMLDDIVGDYKDKTVTLEDFPFFDSPVKMASVHPCRHASVMKVLLDRADGSLKLRKEKLKASKEGSGAGAAGVEGLVEDTKNVSLEDGNKAAAGSGGGDDDWEAIQNEGAEDDEVAIRVDQYVVVFLKFIASVTPGIEHDFTMGI